MNLRIKSLEQILATAEGKSLHRSLGAFQLMMLGVGAIIGTGIFVLTATAAQKAGPASQPPRPLHREEPMTCPQGLAECRHC